MEFHASPIDPEETATLARRLARTGRGAEAVEAWRQACSGYLAAGRPVQAIAAAMAAAGPRAVATDEVVEVARAIAPPVERASGQQILCAIDLPAREALVGRLHPAFFDVDQVVAREGDQAESVWFVVRGQLRAERNGRLGTRQPVGVAGPGAVVGESAVLAGSRRLATLVSDEGTELLELRRRDLEALREVWPSVWHALEAVQRLDGPSGRQHVRA